VRQKKKKKKKKDTFSEKWTKQQKENFERFGDIWYQEPYDNYCVADHDTPAAQAPQPQVQVQQQPVLQQQPAGPPQPPVCLPQQPLIVLPQLLAPQPVPAAPLQPPQGAQPPAPKTVITPPPPQSTPKIQKCRLEAIQKRTRQLDHNVQKLRLRTFLRLKALQEVAHVKHWISWDEEDKQIFLHLMTSSLETFLSSLPSPPRENHH
jgi:hypothetical protein